MRTASKLKKTLHNAIERLRTVKEPLGKLKNAYGRKGDGVRKNSDGTVTKSLSSLYWIEPY